MPKMPYRLISSFLPYTRFSNSIFEEVLVYKVIIALTLIISTYLALKIIKGLFNKVKIKGVGR